MGLLFNFSKAEGVVLLFKLSIQHKITYGPTTWCRSKLYLPRRHHFSLLSGSCSYLQSDEANRYIISVAGPFKLIFQNWDEIRKTFDKGTGHKWTLTFILTFNKLFNKARALKRTCSWRRQLEGTKPVEAKDRVNDYETCESDE